MDSRLAKSLSSASDASFTRREQNAEAKAFLASVAKLPPGPGVSLVDVLKSCLADETELRKLFAQDKTNPRLRDPYVGLVDVFDAPPDIRTTRARVIATPEDIEKSYIMPLDSTSRREEGTLAMVDSLEKFKKNWAIFSVAHKARFMAAVDRKDNVATLNGLAEVLAMRPTTRRLVRLHDIQAFAQRSLDRQNELVHTGQGDRTVEDIPRSQLLRWY